MPASGVERALHKPAVLIRANEPDFKVLFECVPGMYLILRSDLTIVDASDAYLQATMTRREEIIRCHVFNVFPNNPGDPHADGMKQLNASLQRVLASGVLDRMAVQRFDLRDRISGEDHWIERYWLPTNFPVPGRESRKIAYIIHHVEDVTELALLRRCMAERGLMNLDSQIGAELRERTLQKSELGPVANELVAANLHRFAHEGQRVATPTVPWQILQYFAPGSSVPVSAIYQVFHASPCINIPKERRSGRETLFRFTVAAATKYGTVFCRVSIR
jgi:hypothetical protein